MNSILNVDDIAGFTVRWWSRRHLEIYTKIFILECVTSACCRNIFRNFLTPRTAATIGKIHDFVRFIGNFRFVIAIDEGYLNHILFFQIISTVSHSSSKPTVGYAYLYHFHGELCHWFIAFVFHFNFQINELTGCVATDWSTSHNFQWICRTATTFEEYLSLWFDHWILGGEAKKTNENEMNDRFSKSSCFKIFKVHDDRS